MDIIDLTKEDHAYFVGLFQTDGHLQGGTGQRGKAVIELSVKDIDLLRRLSDLFPESNSTVTTRTRTTNFAVDYTSAMWRMCDLSFRRELEACGVPVGRKSVQVGPPESPFHERGYFRGLLDGDGSVGFTRTGLPFVSFVTASARLAAYFCATVKTVTGAVRNSNRNTRDNVFSLLVAGEPGAQLAGWVYPPGCLALDRKRSAAVNVAAWVRPAGMRARPVLGRRSWTAEEDAIVASTTVRDAAQKLNRTEQSVNVRRWRLRNADSRTSLDNPEML
ncbi:MAG: hypothetical protein WBQ44_18930 [Rhodococcus sp. (in: high G+C Gram-positive bacteria)]